MNYRALIYLIFHFIISYTSYSKDKNRDNEYHTIKYTINGNYNKTSNTNTFIFNNSIGYSLTLQKMEFNINSKWIYGLNSNQLSHNDFSTLLDGNYFFNEQKKFNAWILSSYQSSYSLKIYNEFQTGLGLAYKILDSFNSKYFYLRISDGIIFENSDFINSENLYDQYITLRNSLRIQARINFWGQRIGIAHTSFWQPSITIKNDFNFRSITQLNIKLSQNLSINTKYEYNFVSRTEKENTILNFGIGLSYNF